MAVKPTEKKIKISKQYSPDERLAIAEDILEYIRDRSGRGNGPGDRKWTGSKGKYSEGYISSIDFKIAGKSKKTVNQELSGEMLIAMDVLGLRSGEIKYGYESGSTEQGKAEGNIIGSYGKPRGNASKARDFLKLTKAEIRNILSNFPLRGEDAEKKREKSTQSRLEAIAALSDFIDG